MPFATRLIEEYDAATKSIDVIHEKYCTYKDFKYSV